jgi:hypothetical protein
MEDQGLEKINQDLRNTAWLKCVEGKPDLSWENFKNTILQMQFGGASSVAEAYRLFWAEQIKHKVFFSESAFELAKNLSHEIQNNFQNFSRPISKSIDEETQLSEILYYYFSSDEFLDNFKQALNNQLSFTNSNFNNTYNSHNTSVKMTERPQVMAYLNGQSNLLSSRIKKIIDSFT